ncbi:unnamed protein product [marine sediment metagenome]|uniref:NADH:quinone oxidoreductase/Mrp antiporter membrane subunit domain-containing protein n=1 Tax=marine sediment metagenome TaxID=412755 RepID=X1FZF5_9ZZZZ
MIGNLPYVAVVIFVGLGIYTLMFKKNLIKIAIGVVLIENGVNLFLITLGYRKGAVAPIYTYAPSEQAMVLPTPQPYRRQKDEKLNIYHIFSQLNI